MERQRPSSPAFTKIFLLASLVLLYLPILWVLFIAFRSDGSWTIKWVQEVFSDAELMSSFFRSLNLGVLVALASVILAFCATIGVRHSDYLWNRSLPGLSMISLTLPELVFALSLLGYFAKLHFDLGLMSVWAAQVTFITPFAFYIVKARFEIMDRSIEEAAMDLGIGSWGLLFRIHLPWLVPSLICAFIISFLFSFDDFLVSFFTNGVGSDTLPVKLYSSVRTGTSPKLSALSVILILMTSVCLAILAVLLSSKPKQSPQKSN